MARQDIVTLVSTFVIGFSVGVYLFFAGFVPQFLVSSDPTTNQYDSFTIAGEQYGGCARTNQCVAFQLVADGTLSFVVGSNPPGSRQLSRGEMRELTSVLSVAAVKRAAQPAATDDCISYRDGVDYYYEITLDSATYGLDTCTTALLTEPAVAAALDNLWNYFAIP